MNEFEKLDEDLHGIQAALARLFETPGLNEAARANVQASLVTLGSAREILLRAGIEPAKDRCPSCGRKYQE